MACVRACTRACACVRIRGRVRVRARARVRIHARASVRIRTRPHARVRAHIRAHSCVRACLSKVLVRAGLVLVCYWKVVPFVSSLGCGVALEDLGGRVDCTGERGPRPGHILVFPALFQVSSGVLSEVGCEQQPFGVGKRSCLDGPAQNLRSARELVGEPFPGAI